jgi:hypothetical protein
MAENRIKKIYESMGKLPAKGMRELDVPKADTSSFLERRMKMAGPKDLASTLVRATPIGKAGRVAGKALKATGLFGAGYAANEAEDVIREKIEKKKSGGSVFIPKGQKAFQVKKQISRIR